MSFEKWSSHEIALSAVLPGEQAASFCDSSLAFTKALEITGGRIWGDLE